MNLNRLLAVLLAFFPVSVFAVTDSSFAAASMSEATNIPLHGWNRVLMLRDGKTVVLHLAPREKVVVKVFDATHKEVASVAQYFKIIGEVDLEESAFKGFYDIDGKPTLFMMQIIDGHRSLLRISFTPETGKIIDEKIVLEAKGSGSGYDYFVSKRPDTDDYAVFCDRSLDNRNKGNLLTVAYFNGKHEQTKTGNFVIPLKLFDATSLRSIEYNKTGTYVALECQIIETRGYASHVLLLGRLLNDEVTFTVQEIKLQAGLQPNYVFFGFNEFNGAVNVLLCNYSRVEFEDQGFKFYRNLFFSYFGVLEPDMSIRKFKMVDYKEGNRYLAERVDTSYKFKGLALRMHTNKYGVTTLFRRK